MTDENQTSLPEAGGIAFMTLYSKTGAAVNLTARATGPKEALRELIEAVTWAMGEYSMSTDKPMPPAASEPKKDPIVRIAEEEGDPVAAATIQAQVSAVPPSRKGADVPYQTFDADIVEVLPQPDGKTTLAFYGANDKYPRVKVSKWKNDAANGLMKHVTSEDMGTAAKYSLHCRVYWTEGAAFTTKDGKPGNYKDVEHVRPID